MATLLEEDFDVATVVGSGMVLVVTTVVVDGGFGGLVVGAGGLKFSPLLEDVMGIGISRLVVWLVKVAAVKSAVVVIADKLSSFNSVPSLVDKIVGVCDTFVPLVVLEKGSSVVAD